MKGRRPTGKQGTPPKRAARNRRVPEEAYVTMLARLDYYGYPVRPGDPFDDVRRQYDAFVALPLEQKILRRIFHAPLFPRLRTFRTEIPAEARRAPPPSKHNDTGLVMGAKTPLDHPSRPDQDQDDPTKPD